MPKLKDIIPFYAGYFVSLVITYLAISFMNLTTNPYLWTDASRFIFSTAITGGYVMATLGYLMFKD